MSPPASLHALARIAPDDGGPSRAVVALCRALAAEGAGVELVTGSVLGEAPPLPVHVSGTIHRWGRDQPPRGRFASLLLERIERAGIDVLHDHGIWLTSNRAAAAAARRAPVPRIVSPRGMLSPWALAWHGRRKRAAWLAFQRRDLNAAAALHATSDLEAGEICAAGVEAPIAVIPNGVDLPPDPAGRARDDERSDPRPRRLLFLSRIHPKKGLADLVEAWGIARPEGWELVIAGPDEGGHRAQIESRARGLPSAPPVRFLDGVPDARKWELYRSSDVFVLPSRSENFGAVVAEALASGVPVIATRATPWEALAERRCGWWTETGGAPIAQAIAEATSITDGERRAMGARGRRLVEERFAWPVVARRMLATYRWVTGAADTPEWVRGDSR